MATSWVSLMSLTTSCLQSKAECFLSIFARSLGLFTWGTACVYSLTSLHTCSTSTMLLCFIFAFLPIPLTLPSSPSPTSPSLSASMSQAECHLHFLSLSPASSLQTLFQACKSPCARWEDSFLIHPHYQQSASRFEQPCQLLRNETIANIWWISWLSTLLIRQMNCKKKHYYFELMIP